MTQTNNERELIERLALVDIDLRRSHNGFDFIASLSELEAFAKAYKTASDEKSISQNEQQHKQIPDEWVADPDTIPSQLIEITRQAICLEFGDSGTDGYYKRILAKIFKAMLNASPTTSLTSETNTEVVE